MEKDNNRYTANVSKNKEKAGTLIPKDEYSSQKWKESEEKTKAAYAKNKAILEDENIQVPTDLTPQALATASDLTQEDWQTAFNFRFKAAAVPDIKPKILRTIFFRGMDQLNSFDTHYWATRLTLLTINFTEPQFRTEGAQTYLAAVEERKATPNIFVARERYIEMWWAGDTGVPRWNVGAEKRYKKLVTWSEKMYQYYKAHPEVAAQRALAELGEPVTQQGEVDEMTTAFAQLAEKVKAEFSVGDLTRQLSVLEMMGGQTAKGMEGAHEL